MFDAMKLGGQFCRVAVKRGPERFANSRKLCQNLDPVPRERGHLQGIEQFRRNARVGISRHRNVIHLLQLQPGRF